MTGPDRCTLVIHPDDARSRGIADGMLADVTSDSGRITVPIEVSDRIMRGVVSLPHGFGHSRPGTRLTVAQAKPGASLNDLTGANRVDALTGTAAFSGTPVVVTAAGSAALV
jgi:anaerobic selenocysteine-containing dehydrogenase